MGRGVCAAARVSYGFGGANSCTPHGCALRAGKKQARRALRDVNRLRNASFAMLPRRRDC